ncbi:hypothetical protein E2C01_061402 [Portunus trituberculatus]|uniref:Uncharacterized protein n=1 Tax=Portunus trituberculatus TaxID=210409 RepID=A0A5B7H3R9_PORTR|nr:hypothetical protein [Portunus trituberculatus]
MSGRVHPPLSAVIGWLRGSPARYLHVVGWLVRCSIVNSCAWPCVVRAFEHLVLHSPLHAWPLRALVEKLSREHEGKGTRRASTTTTITRNSNISSGGSEESRVVRWRGGGRVGVCGCMGPL